MDHALDLAALGVLAQGVLVIAAAQLDDIALFILHRLVGADHVAAAQAHFATGNQALEAGRRDFFEVAGIDIDLAAERQDAHTHVLLGMTRQFEVFNLAFRVVGDHHLQRLEYAHGPRRVGIQILADGEFQHADIHHAASAVHTDHVAEVADRRRRIAAATEARQRRHPWIVPATHVLLVDQLLELALAGDGVVQVETGEFVLARFGRHRQVVQEPFVERTMVLELQGADRVCDALDGVRLAMGEVIAGVDAPLVAGLVMMGVTDAVQDRVAQVHVRRSHVDLRPQRTGAVGEFAGLHACEQIQVLGDRTLAERAVLARFGQAAAILARLLGRQVADVGLARLDQVNGPCMQLVEIVGGIALFTGPLKAQPLHVALDRVDVFLVFLGRVGVVETQVAYAAEFLGQAEVQADRLGMANVQVAVGLGRKARDDAGMLARIQVGLDDRAEKIGGDGSLRLAHGVLNDLRVCGSREGRPAKSKRLS